MASPSYRRRIFLVNKPFQLRFTFYVCSWLFVLSLVYPLIIRSIFDYFLDRAAQNPFGPLVADIETIKRQIIWLLALMQGLFLSVTVLVSIFVSHRIAGPLYKLRVFMLKARDGNLKDELHFRTHDHFQDLAKTYNEMTDGLRATIARKMAKAATAAAQIEKALERTTDPAGRQELEKAMAAIREIRQDS